MNCVCHGEPAYWSKSDRYRAGGFWRCRVKDLAQKRERYDRDPVYRITKNLHDAARERRTTITRRRAAHVIEQGSG